MNMRILFLNSFKTWGGDENWTVNLAQGLKEKGHHVVISCRPDSATRIKSEERGIETFLFRIGPDISLWKIPPFIKYLRRNRIQVLLAVQNRDIKIGALAARIAGVPAIFGRQGLDMIRKRLDHKVPFTKFLDGIITNSKSLKNLYDGYGWFTGDFVQVVRDGLHMPEKIPELDIHAEFGLNSNAKIIMGTGRLHSQKRFDLLIEVACMIKKEQLNWGIIVVGKGREESKLKRLARDKGADDIIKFVGFRTDVLALMHASDVFVLSSDSEGMSNALREAMAVGTACVATHVFGVEELFQDGKSGIMVKKGDAKAIFEAVKVLLNDPAEKSKIEQSAVALIRDHFTMHQMIDHIEQIFEDQLKIKAKKKAEKLFPTYPPKSILVKLPVKIGDTIMATYMLRAIKEQYPDCKLDVIMDELTIDLSRLMPFIDGVHRFSKKKYSGPRGNYRCGRDIAGRKQYDIFFCLPFSFSSAMAGFFTKSKVRIGFKEEFRSFLFTKALARPPGLHIVEEFNYLLEVFTGEEVDVRPLDFKPPENNIVDFSEKKYLVLNIKSGPPSRSIPIEKAISLTDGLLDKYSYHIVLTGAPNEVEYVSQVKTHFKNEKRVIDLSGKTSLSELAYIISQSEIMLTTDSGNAHLANAVGTPTVVLFGATTLHRAYPYHQKISKTINNPELECLPCNKEHCKFGDVRCLSTIGNDRVFAALDSLIQQN